MEEASSDAGVAPAPLPGAACRINELPDDLLRRAISHMGALQLVQTSVLSRRWRGLWRSVPRINARHRAFFRMADTYKEHDALFKAFVSRFLMLRDPTALDVFNLRYMPDGDLVDYDAKSEDANLWIGHALQCNARSIRVLVTEAKLQLASSLFATNCFLNSLELSNVALFPGFFKNLQKGCTLLERLSLYDCVIFDIEICSQTLKVFTIGSGCDFAFPERASISIPCLVHLGYFTLAPIPLLWPNMESLETASVSVYIHDTRAVSVYTHDTPADDICKVLRSLSGVANLNFHYKGETASFLSLHLYILLALIRLSLKPK